MTRLRAYLRTVLDGDELRIALDLAERELHQAGAELAGLYQGAYDALRPPAVLEDPAVVSIRRRGWVRQLELTDWPHAQGAAEVHRTAWRLGPSLWGRDA